jgi:hypothetical protein
MPDALDFLLGLLTGLGAGAAVTLTVWAFRKANRTVNEVTKRARATDYSNVRQIVLRRSGPGCGFCGKTGHVTVDCDDKRLGEPGPTGDAA